jgi:glycosyltransferase involved in cell wall biosynthesis
MKVLFVTYPHIGLNYGGLRIQIEKTAEALRSLGVDVEFFDPWQNPLDQIDIVHCFSVDSSMGYHVRLAKAHGVPVVVSAVLNVFNRPAWQTILMGRCSGKVPGLFSYPKAVRNILDNANSVLVLQEAEGQLLRKAYGVPTEKMHMIPNGMVKSFANGDPKLFAEHSGLSEYVLNVAFLSPIKNQLNLIKALAGTKYKLVLIGILDRDLPYLEQCREAAGKNVHFIGTLPPGSDLLKSAYAGARVFALPSRTEVMPLTLMEAATAGCRLVASSQVPIQPWMTDFVEMPNPEQPSQIRQAIERQWNAPDSMPTARDTAMSRPDWLEVGKRILEIYQSLPTPVKGSTS